MENSILNLNRFHNKVHSFIVFLLTFFWGISTGEAQLQYATTVLSESHATSSSNSIDANPATYSELEAGTGIIIGIGSYSSHIELQFPAPVPANQTCFVRIETQDNLLSSLMGGTLGNLLSSVVGIALTGNQEFSVDVKNGSNVVLSGSSTNPVSFAGERLKVVIDANNHQYLAITPNQQYQSIRITNLTGSLVGLGAKKHMKVWDPYYVIQGSSCAMPKFTSYDAAGITLELLNLGGGVHNLERVIDANLASHSTLSLGVVSVASSITQRVYFEGLSQPTDVFAVRLGIDPALLAITLGQGIRIRTQNGANVVTNSTLQSLLTPADILALQNNQPVTVYITPNLPVDRVVAELNGLLGVTVSQSLDLFEVYKITQPPTLGINSTNVSICEGTAATLSADAINPTDEIRWYTTMNATTPIGITASGAPFTTGILHSDTTFFIASAIPGCPNESLRIPISVNVVPGPDPSGIIVPVLPEYCAADSVTLGANSTLGTSFQWYLTSTSTTPVVSGQQQGNHTYTIHNDSLSISGLSIADSPFTVYAGVQDTSTGCWSLPGDYVAVTIAIIDQPAPTTSQAQQTFCANQQPTVVDLQTNGGTINWYDAPTGGNLLTSTDALQDSTSYYASSVGPLCESSVRLEVFVVVNDELPPTTTDLSQHFCLSDNATVGDLIITGTNINWYDENGNSLTTSTVLVDNGGYLATTQGATCESSDSLMITVSVSDLPSPTGETTQTFCAVDNPTIEDINLNETTIVWYDENGNSIPAGTPLTDNTSYYAALVSPTCESVAQLEVSVTFETVAEPTTQDTVQVFCSPSGGAPAYTVGDIDVNEANIVWYDAPSGGNVIAASAPLVDGMTYYAAQQGTTCESENRLSVTIFIQNLPAPTATDNTQHFCATTPPTVADLQVNEPNVVWHDQNGTALTATTPLENDATYYAVIDNGVCQSTDSLLVVVTIENQYSGQISGQMNDVCFSDTLVYTAPSGMTNYDWDVTGGTITAGGGATNNTVTVVWQNTSITTINVSYQSTSGCTIYMQEELTITTKVCSDVTVVKTVNNANPFIGDQIVFTIVVTNDGQDQFTNVVVDEVIQSGFTYVSHHATNGTYNLLTGEWTIPLLSANEQAVLTITVTVNPTGNYHNVATITSGVDDDDTDNNGSEVIVEPGCFSVYNEMSPNGDGVNDYFYIDCIEQYASSLVTIYNRYGNVVYTITGYKNDWNGMANVSGTIGKGEPLPAGTYFYLIKVEEGEYESSGWLYIVR